MKKGTLVQIQDNKTFAILVEDVAPNSDTAIALYMTREHPLPRIIELAIQNGLCYFSYANSRFLEEGQYKEELVQLKRMVMYTDVK